MSAISARIFRPHLFHSLIIVALVAACTTGPSASPGPSSPPAAPTATPTASPTVTPAATPTPVPSPTFGEGQIAHPTGATDIVLRMEQGGGFVPMEYFATQAPQFTLYGDGTVVYQDSEQPAFGFGGPLPPFVTGKMSEEGIQALLQYALGTGRLASARETYDNPMVADAPSTMFVINAADLNKVVNIYALGESMPGVPDQADRAGFFLLAELLGTFDKEADAGTVTDVQPYDANLYRATMFDQMGGQPTAEPQDWPWTDLTLEDFPRGDEPGAIRMMSREEVALLVEVPNGGAMSIWVVAPDDSLVQFAFRPLLPDEEAAFESL